MASRTGVVISAILAGAAWVLFIVLPHDAPLAGRIAIGLLIALIIFTYGFLVSYVFGDAKRRGMRHVIWTLVAALVPNALGFIAYFLLREPLLQPCGACGATARRDFAFCPQCGSPLPRACPSCRRPVETTWSHCAHCGTKILGTTPS
ncbi:MAG: zinc ribbon domain-containing protein, partial [Vicinamibacteria bacterium]